MSARNPECIGCDITVADMPWEELDFPDLEEAAAVLFDWLDGKPYCAGCFNAIGGDEA